MKYGKRPLRRHIISSPFTLVGLFILAIILAKAAWNINQKALASAAKVSQAQIELTKLEDRQKDLSHQVGYLSTEQGIEAELRTKYRAVKEGESVAVIVDPPGSAASTTKVISAEPLGWWGRLWHKMGM